MNAEHCWRMSKHAQLVRSAMPSLRWSTTPVPGKWKSGDSVPKMIQSISVASTPASASARLAAWSARSLVAVVPSFGTKRRAWMPVRFWIQSSSVSICCVGCRTWRSFRKGSSWLSTMRSGT